MSLYLKQIEQLIALQRVDDEIHVVRQELEAAPREVATLRDKFTAASTLRDKYLEKMQHLREQEKRLDNEMEDDSSRLKKSKSKLMTAENSKEYHAMVREMDSLERVNRDREEEHTALREEVARHTALLEEAEADFASAKEFLEAAETGLAKRETVAQAELDKLTVKRGETGKEVPMPVYTRYEFIRERLEHPVIVSVSAGICSGCHVSIPPQSFIELQKAAQILSCPNCQRLIFWSDHFVEAASE